MMNIIQIRLEENEREGFNGGYYNYEFGTLNKETVNVYGFATITFKDIKEIPARINYSVSKSEVCFLIGENDVSSI